MNIFIKIRILFNKAAISYVVPLNIKNILKLFLDKILYTNKSIFKLESFYLLIFLLIYFLFVKEFWVLFQFELVLRPRLRVYVDVNKFLIECQDHILKKYKLRFLFVYKWVTGEELFYTSRLLLLKDIIDWPLLDKTKFFIERKFGFYYKPRLQALWCPQMGMQCDLDSYYYYIMRSLSAIISEAHLKDFDKKICLKYEDSFYYKGDTYLTIAYKNVDKFMCTKLINQAFQNLLENLWVYTYWTNLYLEHMNYRLNNTFNLEERQAPFKAIDNILRYNYGVFCLVLRAELWFWIYTETPNGFLKDIARVNFSTTCNHLNNWFKDWMSHLYFNKNKLYKMRGKSMKLWNNKYKIINTKEASSFVKYFCDIPQYENMDKYLIYLSQQEINYWERNPLYGRYFEKLLNIYSLDEIQWSKDSLNEMETILNADNKSSNPVELEYKSFLRRNGPRKKRKRYMFSRKLGI